MTALRARFVGLLSLLSLFGLLVGIPMVLFATNRPPIPDQWPDLTAADDGTALFTLLGMVGWIAWSIGAAMILIEVVAQIRGVDAPRVPGAGIFQNATRGLVAAVALLFVAAPAANAATAVSASANHAPAGLPGVVRLDQARAGVPGAVQRSAVQAPSTGAHTAAPTTGAVRHQVKMGETLWGLAEKYYGQGQRFQEIADANPEIVKARRNWIQEGDVLVIPNAAKGGQHTVQQGETLWGIAQDELGSGGRYNEIFQASRNIRQPGGQQLRDPDLIQPGWQLNVPGGVPQTRPTPQPPVPQRQTPPPSARNHRPAPPPATHRTPAQPPSATPSSSSIPLPSSSSASPSSMPSASVPSSSAPASAAPSSMPSSSQPSSAPSQSDSMRQVNTNSGFQMELPSRVAGQNVQWRIIDINQYKKPGATNVLTAEGEQQLQKQVYPVQLQGIAGASAVAISLNAAGQPDGRYMVKVQDWPQVITADNLRQMFANQSAVNPANPAEKPQVQERGDHLVTAYMHSQASNQNQAGQMHGRQVVVPQQGKSAEVQIVTHDAASADEILQLTESTMRYAGAAAQSADSANPWQVPPINSQSPSSAASSAQESQPAAPVTTGSRSQAPSSSGRHAAESSSPPLEAGVPGVPAPGAPSSPTSPSGSSSVPSPTSSAPAPTSNATAPSGQSTVAGAHASNSPVMDKSKPQAGGLSMEFRDPIRTAGGIGALLAAGILAFVGARRVLQQRKRKPGAAMAMPTGPVAQTEQQLRAAADPLSVEAVDIALRVLAAECTAQGVPLPVVRAAQLTSQEFVLYLADPMQLPQPWIGSANGTVWAITRPIEGVNINALAGVSAPYPALVTVGHDMEDAHVLLDLEYLGTLGIVGDSTDAQEVLTAVAIELGTSIWADDLQVTIVGACAELEDTLQTGRIRYLPTADRAIEELTARADRDRDAMSQAGSPNLQHARAGGLAPGTWSPEIVLLAGPISDSQREQLHALVNGMPRVAVAAVATGEMGEWSVNLNANDDVAVLLPLDLEFRPQRVSAQTYDHIVSMVATTDDEIEDLPPQWTPDSVADGDFQQAASPAAAAPAWDYQEHPDPDATVPAAAAADGGGTVIDLRSRQNATPAWEQSVSPAHRDPDDPTILVLGPVETENITGRVEPAKKARLVEFAAFLALHPGAGDSDIDEAIWPYRAEPDNTRVRNAALSKLRAWLGTNEQGEDYLPRHNEIGYALRPPMTTDWHLWQQWVGPDVATAGTENLEAALHLVRGRPFEGTHPRHYLWAEPYRQHMVSAIVDVSYELARRHIMNNQWRSAEEALVVGLTIEPGMERLWRLRIVAAHESGNQAAQQEAVQRMLAITDALGGELEPETQELLAALENQQPGLPDVVGQ